MVIFTFLGEHGCFSDAAAKYQWLRMLTPAIRHDDSDVLRGCFAYETLKRKRVSLSTTPSSAENCFYLS